METAHKPNLLKIIGKVFEEAQKSKLEPAFFESIDGELSELSDYLKTTKSQAFFVAILFVMSHWKDKVSINNLIDHFHCSIVQILEFNNDFEFLLSRHILTKQKSKYLRKLHPTKNEFAIHESIVEAILHNKPMPELEEPGFKDVIEVLEKIDSLGEERDDGGIPTRELFRETEKIIVENLHFPLIKKVHGFKFETVDSHVFLNLVWETLMGNRTMNINRVAEGIFDRASKQIAYVQKFLWGENRLKNEGLIEIISAKFIDDAEMELSETSLQMLKGFGLKLLMRKSDSENIIKPKSIPKRKLIFNKGEMEQLTLLEKLLREPGFSKTQTRLREKGLPPGITVLLYGPPGTGKTETVKQVAKKTGRAVMKVDISQSKSMWFGESEKITKKIFTDYKTFAKECEQTPILLLNEADAIISKRMDLGSSNVRQTENAIQNIILEELENFEGILAATTNLENNFDLAFERRFLFKIKFQRPKLSAKAKIWKLKFPGLPMWKCDQLALQFDFSGGEIDNIVRKNEIREIIHGKPADFNTLFLFCQEEKLGKRKVAEIGFNKK